MSARIQPDHNARTVVTLIHGTWGRGVVVPRLNPFFGPASGWWFRPGSAFRSRLEMLLPKGEQQFVLEGHDWSGANSVRARADAAHAIAQKIITQSTADKDLQHVLIGHSHGGNVAMKAADELGVHGIDVRVVTLATPFLRVSPRAIGFAHFVIILLALLLCLGTAVLSLNWLEKTLPEYLHWLPLQTVVLWSVFGLLALWVESNERRRKQVIEAINFRPLRKGRVLVLRGYADEATLSLAIGALGAELVHLVLSGLLLPVRIAVAIAVRVARALPTTGSRWFNSLASGSPSVRHGVTCLAALVLVAWLISLSPLSGTEVPVGQAQVFWIALPWAMVGLLLLGGCFLAIHGRELILHIAWLIVTTDSVPDTRGRLDVITLDPSEAPSGLRHGLYNHEHSAAHIAQWLVHGKVGSSA